MSVSGLFMQRTFRTEDNDWKMKAISAIIFINVFILTKNHQSVSTNNHYSHQLNPYVCILLTHCFLSEIAKCSLIAHVGWYCCAVVSTFTQSSGKRLSSPLYIIKQWRGAWASDTLAPSSSAYNLKVHGSEWHWPLCIFIVLLTSW